MAKDQLHELVAAYEPNDKVAAGLGGIKMLATIGPSASGKTTVSKKLAEAGSNVHFILGETSRAPRADEVQGDDYLFRTREEIMADLQSGELVDVIVGPNGDLYSTRLSSFSPGALNVMALIPLGIQKFRTLPLAFFAAAFIVPASYELWRQWLDVQAKISSWDAAKLHQRLSEGKKSYEFALSDAQITFVLNDDPSKAAERLAQVANGELPQEELRARQIAKENLARLTKDVHA